MFYCNDADSLYKLRLEALNTKYIETLEYNFVLRLINAQRIKLGLEETDGSGTDGSGL